MFSSLYNKILNLLFPQKELEKEISFLSADTLQQKMRISNHSDTTALFSYKDPLIRHMIWMLKYKGDRAVAKLFGAVLHSFLLEELSEKKMFEERDFVILPLPLSKKRERERGFNQMVRVAHELEKLGSITIDSNLLKRIKDTPSQTALKGKQEREESVKGVFSTTREIVKDEMIILIDDVLTTGSTMSEAKNTLLLHGAKEVLCIVIAH